jgi:hypothetical protein
MIDRDFGKWNLADDETVTAIKKIKLEPDMIDSISGVIHGREPYLKSLFPDREQGILCTEEFLTSVIQLARYCKVPLERCDAFIDKAVSVEYSPLFAAEISRSVSYINKRLNAWQTSFAGVLNEAVEDLKYELWKCYPEEFADYDDEDDLRSVTIGDPKLAIDADILESEIWKYGLKEEEIKLLVIFWENVSDEDKNAILYPYGSSELEASFALARLLGRPLNPKVERLGKVLSDALLTLRRIEID